jgi:hypothetical protein
MAGFTESTHNMLFTLNKAKWFEDLEKSDNADLTKYQEAEGKPQREALQEWCTKKNRGLYHPKSCGNPISWSKTVFQPVVKANGKPACGVRQVHKSAEAMGVPAKFNPPRDFSWMGLEHTATKNKILAINVHPLAGATKRESAPGNTDSPALSVYKDWGIGQYWLDVVSMVAAQMSIQDPGPQEKASFWDVVTLGGDYNAAMDNKREWYYPASILAALFISDTEFLGGLDHMQATHHSDVRQVRRWKVQGNTDHSIHFAQWEFVPRPDFPRDK